MQAGVDAVPSVVASANQELYRFVQDELARTEQKLGDLSIAVGSVVGSQIDKEQLLATIGAEFEQISVQLATHAEHTTTSTGLPVQSDLAWVALLVRNGDTLSQLMGHFGINREWLPIIVEYNGLRDPDLISAGRLLWLPLNY